MCGQLARQDILDVFFFSSRRRHTRCSRDWSSDVCSSDLRPLGRPARVADEDPQTVHGFVSAEQLAQQFPVRADVDAVKSLDRMFARRVSAKKKPHGPEFDGTAEVHLVVQLREAFEIGKKMRNSNLR